MKKHILFCLILLIGGFVLVKFNPLIARQQQAIGYILEQEKDIAAIESGPHKGGDETVAYRFFRNATDAKLQFTKRILRKGSAMGCHLQKEEEVYYIVSGTGEMNVNGKTFTVTDGDAILTQPGNSHALKQVGEGELVGIVNYLRK